MAQKYRKVDPRVWTDEKFAGMKPEEKLLALWMLTSTRLNRCGILLWSPGLASEETSIPASRIDTVCHTVCHTLSWVRDASGKAVFLARWWRYNSPDNIKAMQGALADLHDVPTAGIMSALIQAAQDIKEPLRGIYLEALQSQNTVCHTVSDRVCHTVSPQEQEQKQEQNQEESHPLLEQGKNGSTGTALVLSNKRPRPTVLVPPILETPEFRAAFSRWEKYRKELRKPLTSTMIEGQFKMLAELAGQSGVGRPIAMIDHTIAMGWQGLREKEQPNGKPVEPERKPFQFRPVPKR